MDKVIKEKMEKIKKWWDGENQEPLVFATFYEEKRKKKNLNCLWEKEDIKPDLEKFVEYQIENLKGISFLGESYPFLPHHWGGRGTPMTMAAYIGGKVIFREEAIWIDKIIDDWEKFHIKFDPENYWVKIGVELMKTQIEKIDDKTLIGMPDFGDALTCFSLIRGTENLLFDVIEKQEILLKKIKEFTDAWKKCHQHFYKIYSEKLPGDTSWLIWAPGKTYACQCDFSTMISPALFEKFVVFELEQIKNYLEYIVWHLDGPDEIKHVDILLSLPSIKAIQIVPGAGNPPCASDLWLPVIKKIIEKGRNVIVYASSKKEVEILIKQIPKGKMALFLEMDFKSKNEAEEVIEWIKK